MNNQFSTLLLICFTFLANGQVQLGADINGLSAGDYAGTSVSISADGSRIAVGAPNSDIGGNNTGLVRVFEEVAEVWTLLGTGIEGDIEMHAGQSVSLSADGNRLAISGYGNEGKVRVYDLIDGDWIQVGLDLNGEEAEAQFGRFMAISANGNRIIVAASLANAGGQDMSGQVGVYEFDGTNWTLLGDVLKGTNENDFFGQAVAISVNGNRVAIGAPGYDGIGENAGHIRLFEFDGMSWIQLGTAIEGESANQNVGHSLALSADGNRVLAGALVDVNSYVRVFDYDGSNWSQTGTNIIGEANGDSFGFSVSISSEGERIAVGANRNDGVGEEAGHVRIYDYVNGIWIKIGDDIDGETADDQSGGAVALSADGHRIAIGASQNDGGGDNAGQVRIYDLLFLINTANNIQEGNVIKIFPNPGKGLISIIGFEGYPKNIQIMDLTGKVIRHFNQVNQSLDLSELEPGFYFVSIKVEEKIIIRKLMLQK